MKKLFAFALVIVSFFGTERVYSGQPEFPELMFGNPEFIHYDRDSHVFVNTNLADNWLLAAIAATRSSDEKTKLRHLYEIPEKHKVILVFRLENARKRETFYAQAFFAAATTQNRRRLVLVNVEQTILDLTSEKDKQYRVWPHLGMLYVGTVAHEEGWDVVLWDELVQGHSDLASLVEPGDVVGLSIVVTGIERGVELAKQAKTLGAECVIAGNDSAAFRVNQLLTLPGRPIDAVFNSNRLRPIRLFFKHFGKYFETKDLKYMRNPGMDGRPGAKERSNVRSVLVSELKTRKQLERTGSFELEDVFIVPKFDLFPQSYWDEVWANYRQVFGHKDRNGYAVRNGIALFAQGCTRTRGTDVCSYCTIADVADIRIPSEEYLRRTLEAYERFGIRTIYNVTDSAYEMQPLVKRLQNVGASLDALTIYGRAQGIAQHPELLDEWLQIVDDRLLINVGMDSGDARILEQGVLKSSLGKGSRLEENYEAVRRVNGSGANLFYSLIFGSPGETRESCERSIEFLEWSIATLGSQLDVVETDYFWLNFGSPAGRVFTDYDYAQSLATISGKSISREEWYESFAKHSNELIVPWSAEQAWYRHFTDIDTDVAQGYNQRVVAIMARHEGSISGRAYKPSKE